VDANPEEVAMTREIRICFTAMLGLLFMTSMAVSQEPIAKTQNTVSSKEEVSIPKNLDECFSTLTKMLPAQELDAFKNKSEDNAVTDAHFGLGMWIRNNWIHPAFSPLGNYLRDMGLHHPDDMSSVILGTFWCHLNGKPLRVEERIRGYDEYWKYNSSPKDLKSPKDGTVLKWQMSVPCKDFGMPKNCTTHFYINEKDQSVWAYQYGKGLFEPTEDQKNEVLGSYKNFLRNSQNSGR
jgi:hypothetical protein